MIIHKEIALEDFDGWCGAEDTLMRVYNEGKIRDLEAILEDMYPGGIDETDLNDLLRFDSDTVYEWLGMKTDEEINEEEEERVRKLKLIEDLKKETSARSFCAAWENDFDGTCRWCPLYDDENCDDDEALVRCHDKVMKELDLLKKELEEDE